MLVAKIESKRTNRAGEQNEQQERGWLLAAIAPHVVVGKRNEEGVAQEPVGSLVAPVAGMQPEGTGVEELVVAAKLPFSRKEAEGHCCRRERKGGGLSRNTVTHENPKGALKTRPCPCCLKHHRK